MVALNSAAHTHIQAYFFYNSAYPMSTLPAVVHFLHRDCFIPFLDAYYKAIYAGYFTNWPGHTSKLVCKLLPASIEMSKGHLNVTCQHVRSTRYQPTRTPLPQPIHQSMITAGILQSDNPSQENLICMWTFAVSCQIFSDQTGRFP